MECAEFMETLQVLPPEGELGNQVTSFPTTLFIIWLLKPVMIIMMTMSKTLA